MDFVFPFERAPRAPQNQSWNVKLHAVRPRPTQLWTGGAGGQNYSSGKQSSEHPSAHRHTDTEIDIYTCTQIHRYTNTQIRGYSHIQIHTYSEMLFEPRTSVYAVLCTAYFVVCTVHWAEYPVFEIPVTHYWRQNGSCSKTRFPCRSCVKKTIRTTCSDNI